MVRHGSLSLLRKGRCDDEKDKGKNNRISNPDGNIIIDNPTDEQK